MGEGSIAVTTRSLTFGGQPWVPVMGEYHFSRDRPERWERELRKVRAGGIDVVSTYLLWILHEPEPGALRWDGHLNLREFVQAADRAGLKVIIRIGPWAHGETRNGGFPDWLQALPIKHRTNDPQYLDLVRAWYTGIAEQVQGLFHSAQHPAGPIVGIQVDNELYDEPGHLATLRELAESAGMKAALWTATGWGGAQLPENRLLPVYAGYSDAFWEESTTGWPSFGPMHFTFSTVRDDLSVGADLRDVPLEGTGVSAEHDPWPFATCELGGGMQVAYHRRPLVEPHDVAALALTKIGSGSSWQGYYLYHGCTQLPGTQESHATSYPNDLPVRDYDFAAPIGLAGTLRPHYHLLRRQHLFLEAFGRELAPLPSVLPIGEDPVRWAVRGEGEAGYLFVNNHQPALAPLEDVGGVRFEVAAGERVVGIPVNPVRVPAGAYFAWPLRQRFGDIPALTVTAQPITQIVADGRTVVLFAATPGIDVELQLEGVAVELVSGAELEPRGAELIARPHGEPGLGCEVTVGATTLVFLDEAGANTVWKGEIDGRESLVLWDGTAWFDGGLHIEVPQTDQPIAVFPPLAEREQKLSPGTVFTSYVVTGEATLHAVPAPQFHEIRSAPVRTGGSMNRFSAPTDADFAALPAVPVEVPVQALTGEGPALLRLTWVGDVIRLYAGDRLVADQFWSGRPLEVDLSVHRDEIARAGLWARAFAWAPESGVYVDARVRPAGSEPVLSVQEASLQRIRTRILR
nr:beta-galactosidase [Kineosporia babensis]